MKVLVMFLTGCAWCAGIVAGEECGGVELAARDSYVRERMNVVHFSDDVEHVITSCPYVLTTRERALGCMVFAGGCAATGAGCSTTALMLPVVDFVWAIVAGAGVFGLGFAPFVALLMCGGGCGCLTSQ